jgi:Cu+-exporting ATPase
MSIMVGTGAGARAGVLIKNAEALELLARVDTLVVDKTGTLTEGRPRLTAIEVAGAWSADEVLRLAAAVERGSQHPLAAAIVGEAERRHLEVPPVAEFQSTTGLGVSGRVDGRRVDLGNVELMRSRGIDAGTFATRADERRREGQTVLLVAIDGTPAGLIAVADPIRPSADEAIRALKAEGVTPVMLTGDNRLTADAIARQLGIEDVRAEVLPADKRSIVEALQRAGHLVAMAGDGINDAPALALADVGIAMGSGGATVSSETADAVVLVDRVDRVADAIAFSRRGLYIARQSVLLGMGASSIAMVFAAFGYLPPVAGALLQEVIDVAVILNALRALKG